MFSWTPSRWRKPSLCTAAFRSSCERRSLDVGGMVHRHVRLKKRERGLDEAGYVESFLVLNALGGDSLEDFDRLWEDDGL